jgi:hypothetical protein
MIVFFVISLSVVTVCALNPVLLVFRPMRHNVSCLCFYSTLTESLKYNIAFCSFSRNHD